MKQRLWVRISSGASFVYFILFHFIYSKYCKVYVLKTTIKHYCNLMDTNTTTRYEAYSSVGRKKKYAHSQYFTHFTAMTISDENLWSFFFIFTIIIVAVSQALEHNCEDFDHYSAICAPESEINHCNQSTQTDLCDLNCVCSEHDS